jgi:RNA polymerase sigma-70 factor (ECF subfamily)
VEFDDAQVMRQVQAGDFASFDRIVLRYRGPLLQVAWSKLGNRTWAEDVVQETFLAAFAARHTYRAEFSFRTWLWTILLNLCRKQWKRREERPREFSFSGPGDQDRPSVPEPACEETGLSRILHIERREQLLELLGRLPEPQADALRLRFFGGLKFSEIAMAMDSSESAAKVRVKHGLQALAHLYRAQEGVSP